MKQPRGHFNLDGLFFDLFLFFGFPVLSVATFVCLLVLKIWFTFSWWWLLAPVGVFAVWLATVQILSRSK